MAKYPSTLLPQNNTPQENQKAVLDLLDKTNKVHDDATSGINAAKAELQKQINAVNKIHAYVCCLGNSAVGANTAIIFAETLDTNDCYNAGIFTAPANGVVLVTASAYGTGVLSVGKNSIYDYVYLQPGNAVWGGAMLIPVITGDAVYITSNYSVPSNSKNGLSFIFTEL